MCASLPRLMDRMLGAVLMFFVSGCYLDSDRDRIAGTSTSVGDTADGVAILSDGGAAAGASVVARSETIEFKDGKPQGVLLASARADANGRFQLAAKDLHGSYYLEIVCNSADPCGKAGSEVYFGFRAGGSGRLGEFKLSPPGSVLAKVLWLSLPDSATWMGLSGSARFVQLRKPQGPGGGDTAEVSLDGLYPGLHHIAILGEDPANARIQPVGIQAGQVTSFNIVIE